MNGKEPPKTPSGNSISASILHTMALALFSGSKLCFPLNSAYPHSPKLLHLEYGKTPDSGIIMILGSRSLAITVLCLGVDWVSLSIGLLSIVVVVVVACKTHLTTLISSSTSSWLSFSS